MAAIVRRTAMVVLLAVTLSACGSQRTIEHHDDGCSERFRMWVIFQFDNRTKPLTAEECAKYGRQAR